MADDVDPFAKPDPIGKEIVLKASVEASGLAVQAKIRAATALDRMVGAALDIPGVWLEQRAERARIIAVAEQEAMKIDARFFLQDRQAQISQPSTSSWLNNVLRKIDNKAKVVSFAIEEIKTIKDTQESNDANQDYDFDDWLNAFVNRAEMASSENMQAIFGKILAGEICRPSSFSIATLRIIAELDQRSAKHFQQICGQVVNKRYIPRQKGEIMNEALLDLHDLEERGLIKEVGGGISTELERSKDGFYYFIEHSFVLKMIIEPVNEYIAISNVIGFYLLTKSGEQISSILPKSKDAGLRAVASQLSQHMAVKLIELHEVDDGISKIIEVLLKR